MSKSEFFRDVKESLNKYISDTMQRASYELGDLLNRQDRFDYLLYLAQIQVTVTALRLNLTKTEQQILEQIVNHTEVTVMPSEFDPRPKEVTPDA